MTAELSTPLFSRLDRNPIDVLMPKPISCSAVLFVRSDCASLSIGTPVFCPALFNMSRTSAASSASSPKAAIAACTLSMDELTSVPFNSANLIN